MVPYGAKPLEPIVTDRIFDNGVVGVHNPSAFTDIDTPEGYQAYITEMISDAVDYEDSYLAPAREENLKYYYGESPAVDNVDEDGAPTSSTVVSTDVRDTVMAIMPSYMKCFTAPEHIVFCTPNYEGQEDAAKQATQYLEHVFWKDNDGFSMLYGAGKDALTTKTCVARWWTENNKEIVQQTYMNIEPNQLAMFMQENPDVELVNREELQESIDNPGMIEEVKLKWQAERPVHRVAGVPLDEFRISRNAKSVADATLIGQDSIVRTSWLVSQGYSPELIDQFRNPSRPYSIDRIFRSEAWDGGNVGNEYEVRYGDYFIRVDADDDGIDELHHICTIGDQYLIIKDEIVQYANFAVGSPDPKSHTIIGDCPADLVRDIQRVKTNMLRGSLDSLAQSIWPRTVFNEVLVNVDDVLNDEIGAAIRTKGNPAETLMSINHTFVGEPVFRMFDQMEMLRTRRTGISDASKGLDPKAMQSTNVNGIDAIVTGQQERIELICLCLAHTFIRPIFEGLLREITAKPAPKRMLQISGKWTPIEPSKFDANMPIWVNGTMGKGSDMTRLMALTDVKATQENIIAKWGIKNPLVGPEEYRNTIVDMLAIVNIKNTTRYFKEVDPETLQAIMEAPEDPDPTVILAQAEAEKVRAQTAKAISEKNTDLLDLKMTDDRERDFHMMDGILKLADLSLQAQEMNNDLIVSQQELADIDAPG